MILSFDVKIFTDESDIDATGSKGSAFSGPPQSVFEDPSIETIFGFLGQTKVGCSNALQDVVVVLGGTKDARRRVGNIPVD